MTPSAADLHREAMAFADRAMLATLKGDHGSALELYRQAFDNERRAALAARDADIGEPTVWILHRSAATLALDAKEVREAERLVATALAFDPPSAIADELRDLWEQVQFRRHLALRGLELSPSEFQFSMTGSAVGFGIVASDEFVERVQTLETLLYRTAERRLGRPFRDRGRRKQSLQKEIDIYVSVPRAASFAVTFRIGRSDQLPLPLPELTTFADELIDEVLTCFDMLNRGKDETIRERIREPAYFRNFIGLASKIAPDGHDITGVGFTAAKAGETREVALVRSKTALPSPEATPPPEPAAEAGEPVVVTGRLEYASKLQDEREIRIETDTGRVYRVIVPEGLMNDIVKPLWDEHVTVHGTRRRDRIFLVRIDPAEAEG